jgi:hypothetical protein
MTWWGTDLGSSNSKVFRDPKRKYKFLVEFGNGGTLFPVKTVEKPGVTIKTDQYKMINHIFNYPGMVEWNDISMTLVDFGTFGSNTTEGKSSTSEKLWDLLMKSGYRVPGNAPDGMFTSIEKKSSVNAFSNIIIYQIDSGQMNTDGKIEVNWLEKWELKNPLITKITWGSLDYSSEDLVEYTLDIKYDWAEYTTGPGKIT